MKQAKRAACGAILALTALGASAMPAAAATHEVSPGQSIQAAIDAAAPGDTVLVHAGTYNEYLQIANKDRITLKGQHATLMPPSGTPADTLCNSMGDLTGICITGDLGTPQGENPPPINRRSVGDRVTGFKISGFEAMGVFSFGVKNLKIDHNTFTKNGEYGVFSNSTVGTRLVRNVARNNDGEAGFYVGDSQKARAFISHNRAINNEGSGFFLRDVSHGVVTHNTASGNCIGVFLLGDAPGPANDWRIARNRVNANNRACPANKEEGSPPLSGFGIVVSGGQHIRVIANRVHGNRKLHPSVDSGGILVGKGDRGTLPKDVAVRRNRAFGNGPFDIKWDETGSAVFQNNNCGKSKPASICG